MAPEGSDSPSLSGIFIKNVLTGSPAAATNQLNTGDRIIAVGDVDLRYASHDKVGKLRRAKNILCFYNTLCLQLGDDNINMLYLIYCMLQGVEAIRQAGNPLKLIVQSSPQCCLVRRRSQPVGCGRVQQLPGRNSLTIIDCYR